MILGCPGSGKTSLSLRISGILGIQAYHLDDFQWGERWVRRSSDVVHREVAGIISQSQWILDGNYLPTMKPRVENADIIVFLDYPTVVCLARALKRLLSRLAGERESLPVRVRNETTYRYRLRFRPGFLMKMCLFRLLSRSRVLDKIAHAGAATVHVLSNPRETEEFLENLARDAGSDRPGGR